MCQPQIINIRNKGFYRSLLSIQTAAVVDVCQDKETYKATAIISSLCNAIQHHPSVTHPRQRSLPLNFMLKQLKPAHFLLAKKAACIAPMHLIIPRCIYTILVVWKKSCDILSTLHIWIQQKNISYIYKASKYKQLNDRNMVNPTSIFKVTTSQLSISHIRSYIPSHIHTWQYSWHHPCH
jgi:hypothetical protein